MTDLGEIGRPKVDAEVVTFGYFGERLRAHPHITDVAVIRLVKRLGGAEKLLAELDAADDDPKALDATMGVLDDLVGALVHPDDVEQFWATAQANGQDSGDIADAVLQIMEGVTDRPTVRPSDSSDGSQRTSPRSEGGSSSAVIHRLERRGRPDLAQFVAQAQGASV